MRSGAREPNREGKGDSGLMVGTGLRCREGPDHCPGLFLRMPLETGWIFRACANPLPCVWGSAADPLLCPCEQQKEAEAASLAQRVTVMAGRVQELSTPSALDARAVPALKKQLWDLEASAAEQKKELERQTAAVDHLEEVAWPPWACQAHTSTIIVPPGVGATTGVFISGSFSSTSGWSWR